MPAVPQPVPVTAAEVQRQDVPIVLEGVGTVQALYTATIRSHVTGTLEEVDFSEGQKVKRGPDHHARGLHQLRNFTLRIFTNFFGAVDSPCSARCRAT
jgi:hypothetical protein